MNGAAAVARYTLIELSRRRIVLVFFIIGAAGIALIGVGLKVFSTAFSGVVVTGPNGQAPDPAKLQRVFELGHGLARVHAATLGVKQRANAVDGQRRGQCILAHLSCTRFTMATNTSSGW